MARVRAGARTVAHGVRGALPVEHHVARGVLVEHLRSRECYPGPRDLYKYSPA